MLERQVEVRLLKQKTDLQSTTLPFIETPKKLEN
jgi:hypothetical protein